jgi:hypothetical protein
MSYDDYLIQKHRRRKRREHRKNYDKPPQAHATIKALEHKRFRQRIKEGIEVHERFDKSHLQEYLDDDVVNE